MFQPRPCSALFSMAVMVTPSWLSFPVCQAEPATPPARDHVPTKSSKFHMAPGGRESSLNRIEIAESDSDYVCVAAEPHTAGQGTTKVIGTTDGETHRLPDPSTAKQPALPRAPRSTSSRRRISEVALRRSADAPQHLRLPIMRRKLDRPWSVRPFMPAPEITENPFLLL